MIYDIYRYDSRYVSGVMFNGDEQKSASCCGLFRYGTPSILPVFNISEERSTLRFRVVLQDGNITLPPSGLLRGVSRFKTDVSGLPVGSIP